MSADAFLVVVLNDNIYMQNANIIKLSANKYKV